MERPPGHTAESNNILPALSWRRIGLALALVATAGILFWSRPAENLKHESARHQDVPTRPHRMKSTGAHERDHVSPLSRSSREDHQPSAFDIELPHPIEQYLYSLDDEEAERLHPFVHEHIGYDEVNKLILRYHLLDAGWDTDRIITLLSNLKSPDSLASAKKAVLQNEYELDDPILLACATSLAKNGGNDSIQAILERLNQTTLDDSGNVPENAASLINSLALVSDPDLEWFIGQAAEGKWIASSTASRMAAISALRSYPNIHTTSILARLKNEDESSPIRHLATDVLTHIQQQDP